MIITMIFFAVCQAVGVTDSNRISNAQMTASSYYNANYHPYNARLNKRRGKGGWAPITSGGPRTDWLQVDMATIQSVCGVATQGLAQLNEWTTSYVLHMSKDEITWNPYKENNTEKVNEGS